MQKKISMLFSISLTVLMLCTCIFGCRAIGKSLYLYCRSLGEESIIDSIDSFFETVDDAFTKNFCLKESCISVYGLIQKIEGKTIIEDATPDKTVLLGSDGKLYFRGGITDELNIAGDSSMLENISKISELNQYCAAQGVNLLYVIAPHKYSTLNAQVPENRKDYTEDTFMFSELLSDANISNINLMGRLLDTNKYSDAFFVTDHHWNMRTAFWGFERICEEMNAEFNSGIMEEQFASESFQTKIYHEAYLGSMGTRVGRFYAGMDDIEAISPQYDTQFKVSFLSKTLGRKVERTGNFDEAIFADNEPGYHMYITSDNSLIHVDNLLDNKGQKTLLIKDSFGVPVSAWLSCCFDELWVMDLRYPQDESVKDFITDHGINNVIIIYNPEVMYSATMFEFNEIIR